MHQSSYHGYSSSTWKILLPLHVPSSGNYFETGKCRRRKDSNVKVHWSFPISNVPTTQPPSGTDGCCNCWSACIGPSLCSTSTGCGQEVTSSMSLGVKKTTAANTTL